MDGSLLLLPLIITHFAFPAPAAEPVSSPAWLDLVEPLPCSGAVERLLFEWGASAEVRRAPPGVDGRPRYRIATHRIGEWITLGTGVSPRLFHTTAERTLVVEMAPGCVPRFREVPSLQSGEGPGFDDGDLEALLARHPDTVVYVWSPHLPLSVEGYAQIEAAARELGLGFAAVVDPSADAGYVDSAADEAGIPVSARRRLASIELLARDLAVHSPAILVFASGRATTVLPGYRSQAAYTRYLESLFER